MGEVNVTTKMKEVGAVIGGEGNGGVIYPESHYGRDALVGIALFLSSLAQKGCKASELRASFPNYFIAKNRIDLQPTTDVDAILAKMKEKYSGAEGVQVTDIDGVKLDFPTKWVHMRKSNTEPIIRVYSEASSMAEAGILVGAHDIGKAILAVALARLLSPSLPLASAAAGVACVLGHMFPFYLRFRGGKGFASYLGMTIALNWRSTVCR